MQVAPPAQILAEIDTATQATGRMQTQLAGELRDAQAKITLLETLRLPEPLAAWKDYQNDPAADTQISADAQSAVTTLRVVPEPDGWVTHGWCVTEGDPLGAHTLAVALAGRGIAYIPEHSVREALADGRLQRVMADRIHACGTFYLLWPSGRHVLPKLRVFIDFISARHCASNCM